MEISPREGNMWLQQQTMDSVKSSGRAKTETRQGQVGCHGEGKGSIEDRVLGCQEREPSRILRGRAQGHLLERPSASVLHRPSSRQQLDAAPRMGCVQGLGKAQGLSQRDSLKTMGCAGHSCTVCESKWTTRRADVS